VLLVDQNHIFSVDVDGQLSTVFGDLLGKGCWGEAAEVSSEGVDLNSCEVGRDFGGVELGSWLADVEGDDTKGILMAFLILSECALRI
jgi:hypothetical protein